MTKTLEKAIPFIGVLVITGFSIGKLVTNGLDLVKLLAATFLLLVMIGVSSYYFIQFYESQLKKLRYQMMFWIFIFIGYLPSLLLANVNPFLMPILLTAALVTSMIHVRLGFIINFVMLSLLLITTGISVEIYLLYLVAGGFICLVIPFAKNRHQVMYVAGSSIVFFMLMNVVNWMVSHGNLDGYNYLNLLYSALNGLFIIVFSIGTEPIWEIMFRITSDARLIELSNSNEELLKRLMIEAPGTYHHSMMVANLAEKAAIEIKINYHVARVGSLYHDIGKLRNPEYFTENQQGVNIHDDIAPEASAKFIIDHVTDGLELAKEYKLPKEIQNIITEHQGDSLVSYFYQRAMEHSDGFEIDQDLFRYPGPKPQTKESAVVMLADCVDAAIKSVSEDQRSNENISQMIEKVVASVIAKKQLDDSPLSFMELRIIKKAFLSVYNGMYHERIQYDRS